jgi:hypothetical protein
LTKGSIVGNGRDRVHRGDEMVVSSGVAGALGAHGIAGRLQNIGMEDSKRDALTTTREGEVATKSQDTNAVSAPVPVTSITMVERSVGVPGGIHPFTIEDGNKDGLRTDTESTVIARSQEFAGDVVPVNEGHRMLLATPTSLEVGVANGSHGWLKIRAELTDGGTVNASVSAASSVGQEMLHRELPSLTAYLQSERLGVSTVVVHGAAATTVGRDFAEAVSSDDQGGSAQHGGDGQRGDAHEGLVAAGSEARTFVGVDEEDAATLSSAVYGEGGSGGGWLSVMA